MKKLLLILTLFVLTNSVNSQVVTRFTQITGEIRRLPYYEVIPAGTPRYDALIKFIAEIEKMPCLNCPDSLSKKRFDNCLSPSDRQKLKSAEIQKLKSK